MSTREHVQSVIVGLRPGNILETFDKYYAGDAIMSENGVDERGSKSANREYEVNFVRNVEFHNTEVMSVIVDGNKAPVRWTFEFTPKNGSHIVQKQVAVQT